MSKNNQALRAKMLLNSELALFSRFMDRYFETCVSNTVLFENVVETLRELKGFSKVVLTNKSNRFVPKILSSLRIESYFDEAFGRESFLKSKPDPLPIHSILKKYNLSPSQALIVGDTEADILSGQSANIHTCLVTYGFGRAEEVAKLNPTFLIANFKELLAIVSPDGGR
ncbi:MAG: HAD family hydrolase [Bdellovibrionales bacterium]